MRLDTNTLREHFEAFILEESKRFTGVEMSVVDKAVSFARAPGGFAYENAMMNYLLVIWIGAHTKYVDPDQVAVPAEKLVIQEENHGGYTASHCICCGGRGWDGKEEHWHKK
jgi:hypothetical protein